MGFRRGGGGAGTSHVRLVGQRRVDVSVVLDDHIERFEELVTGHGEQLANAHVVRPRRVEGDPHVEDWGNAAFWMLEEEAEEPPQRERVLARREAAVALVKVVGEARQVADPRVGKHQAIKGDGPFCARRRPEAAVWSPKSDALDASA